MILNETSILQHAENTEMIIACRDTNGKGVKIPRVYYDIVANFIVDVLRQRSTINLHELLDEADAKLKTLIKENLNYHILMVKNDLEGRKIIKVTRGIGPERLQVLHLRRRTIL